jgi:hypothetical protein
MQPRNSGINKSVPLPVQIQFIPLLLGFAAGLNERAFFLSFFF